jgi:hypothetical protein
MRHEEVNNEVEIQNYQHDILCIIHRVLQQTGTGKQCPETGG